MDTEGVHSWVSTNYISSRQHPSVLCPLDVQEFLIDMFLSIPLHLHLVQLLLLQNS